MTKFKKSVTIPTMVFCAVGWTWLVGNAIHYSKEVEEDVISTKSNINAEEVLKSYQPESKYKPIYDKYERLKKEEEERERKRLAELERQRLIKLEEERLAKIKAEEERKKQVELKRLEVEKKKKQDYPTSKGEWMTFEASYYTSSCKGCSGFTYTEIDVRNTIYYKGYRVVATDKRVLPMGTLVQVKTPHEEFTGVIADVGGAIKNKKLDILVKSKKEAYSLGKHNVQLRVVGKIDIK